MRTRNTPAMRIVFIFVILFLSIAFVGCQTSGVARDKSIEDLDPQISRAGLEEFFGYQGRFQFLAEVDGHTYECVSFPFVEEYNYYHFVFRDDALNGIHNAYEFREYETEPFRGARREVEKTWEDEERLNKIIRADDIGIDGLATRLETFRKENEGAKGRGSLNLWPIAIASVAFLPAAAVGNVKRNNKEQSWLSDFDPRKIALGMSEEQVQRLMGNPTFRIEVFDQLTLAFGPDETLLIRAAQEEIRLEEAARFWSRPKDRILLDHDKVHLWVAVVIEDGKVTRIFSDELFNYRVLVSYDNLVKP